MKKAILLCAFFCAAFQLAVPANLSAEEDGLKKVLILDFANIEKNPNYQYLEASITDAVKDMLKERFLFKETDPSKWQDVAVSNYQYREDYYTKSAAMIIGLLSKQDVVISGGFRIEKKESVVEIDTPDSENQNTTDGTIRVNNPSAPKTQKEITAVIITQVKILDITKKEVIAEFTEEGPADSRIFTSVGKIANRISKEAAVILPNKEEWEKKGIKEITVKPPIIGNFQIGLRGGGIYYLGGIANRIIPDQPSLFADFSVNFPRFYNNLRAHLRFGFFSQAPSEEYNPEMDDFDVASENLILGFFLGWKFNLLKNFDIRPQIGGGNIMQFTSISGFKKATALITIPFAGTGAELSYRLNQNLSIVLEYQGLLEIENYGMMLMNLGHIGVNFKI